MNHKVLLYAVLMSCCSWFKGALTQQGQQERHDLMASSPLLKGFTLTLSGQSNLSKNFSALNNLEVKLASLVNTTPATSTGILKPGETFVGVDGVSVTAPSAEIYIDGSEGEVITELQVTIERVDLRTIKTKYLEELHPLISVYRITTDKTVSETSQGFKVIIPTHLQHDRNQMNLFLLVADSFADEDYNIISTDNYDRLSIWGIEIYIPGILITTTLHHINSGYGDLIIIDNSPDIRPKLPIR